MPNADSSNDRRSWLYPALLIAGSVTAFRVLMLAFNRTDLFVDEAQYWLWGQELAPGYYSKPPMIAWSIRLSTEIGGSDSGFWVRLPAPLLHFATAMVLGAIARPRFGDGAAIWAVAIYVTLPMVALGSLLISTDTMMVPFLALALWAWWRGLDVGGSIPWAGLAGLFLGLAFLGKYAAIYYLICAALAAACLWQARPGWRAALAGLAAFAVAISPNVYWNLANGLSTLEHTLDNADWVRDPGQRTTWNLAGFGEFFGSQFIVFGPILFAVLLWLGLRYRSAPADRRFLLLFSLPIVAIVAGQSLLSHAYANWAAAAYLAATLAVVPWLLERPRGWILASLGINLFFTLLLPVATVFGTEWRLGADGSLVLQRYLGRTEMSERILDMAEVRQASAIVADDRDILADLFYTARGRGIPIYARPVAGRAPNHYVLEHSLPADLQGTALYVSKRSRPRLDCPAQELGRLAPKDGAYSNRAQNLFLVAADCVARPE